MSRQVYFRDHSASYGDDGRSGNDLGPDGASHQHGAQYYAHHGHYGYETSNAYGAPGGRNNYMNTMAALPSGAHNHSSSFAPLQGRSGAVVNPVVARDANSASAESFVEGSFSQPPVTPASKRFDTNPQTRYYSLVLVVIGILFTCPEPISQSAMVAMINRLFNDCEQSLVRPFTLQDLQYFQQMYVKITSSLECWVGYLAAMWDVQFKGLEWLVNGLDKGFKHGANPLFGLDLELYVNDVFESRYMYKESLRIDTTGTLIDSLKNIQSDIVSEAVQCDIIRADGFTDTWTSDHISPQARVALTYEGPGVRLEDNAFPNYPPVIGYPDGYKPCNNKLLAKKFLEGLTEAERQRFLATVQELVGMSNPSNIGQSVNSSGARRDLPSTEFAREELDSDEEDGEADEEDYEEDDDDEEDEDDEVDDNDDEEDEDEDEQQADVPARRQLPPFPSPSFPFQQGPATAPAQQTSWNQSTHSTLSTPRTMPSQLLGPRASGVQFAIPNWSQPSRAVVGVSPRITIGSGNPISGGFAYGHKRRGSSDSGIARTAKTSKTGMHASPSTLPVNHPGNSVQGMAERPSSGVSRLTFLDPSGFAYSGASSYPTPASSTFGDGMHTFTGGVSGGPSMPAFSAGHSMSDFSAGPEYSGVSAPSISGLSPAPHYSGITAPSILDFSSAGPQYSGITTPSISGFSAAPNVSGISGPAFSGLSAPPSSSGITLPVPAGLTPAPPYPGITTPSLSSHSAAPSYSDISAGPSVTTFTQPQNLPSSTTANDHTFTAQAFNTDDSELFGSFENTNTNFTTNVTDNANA